jgi:hypothetical protein
MKRFKSADGSEVRVALETGHVTIIGNEWTELHERFHSQAYANGCISEDMAKLAEIKLNKETVNKIETVALKKEKIKGAIQQLLEEFDQANFTNGTNLPKSTVLTKMIGEKVSNSERDEVWYGMQKDIED